MYKYLYIYIGLFTYQFLFAQTNLINNYSFENYSSCPASYGGLPLATGWNNPSSNASPDYYNACSVPPTYLGIVGTPSNCSGYQIPKTGAGYAGFFICDATNDSVNIGAEFIQTQLATPLQNNVCYYFEMNYSLSNSSGLGINSLSAYLSTTQFTTSSGQYYNSLAPQITLDTNTFITDTLNWVKLSGYFTASGGEKYITIGNFRDGLHIKQQQVNGSNNSFCTFSNNKFCYILIDDVILYACTDVGIQNLENDHSVSLYPNPANTEVYISAKGYEQLTISVYNIMGELVIQQALSHRQGIDVKMLNPGTYMYRLFNGPTEVKNGKLMISK